MKFDISIVIPARNEEKYLPNCLEAIKRAEEVAKLNVEIICVVNRSTDKTEEIARAAGCKVVKSEAKNLSIIRNSGVKEASAKYIVTIDADSIMSKAMLKKVKQLLDGDKYIGGGVMIFPERYSLGIILTAICLVPLIMKYQISGGMFFFRKGDFNDISGFDEKKVSVEDIDFAIRLKKYGKRRKQRYATILTESITTSCRKFDHFGDWYLLKNPKFFWRILFANSQDDANKYWYDIPR